jgi:hypothetical protein
MKLFFFLLAFCLITARVYFSWAGESNKDKSFSDIVMRSDGFEEEIKYAGKIRLLDDETGFKSISPGGYIKFKRNEETVKAESNLKGEIEYSIYDGKEQLDYSGSGKELVALAIREMIAWGYDANNRMLRLYQKGGNSSLLQAFDSLKSDPVKVMYLNHVLNDSPSTEDLNAAVERIGRIGSDPDQAELLRKISVTQLNNPAVSAAYFGALNKMSSDVDKAATLRYLLNQAVHDSLNLAAILQSSKKLSSGPDQADLYSQIISKGLAKGSLYDSLLRSVSEINSDPDKSNLYQKIIQWDSLSEPEWNSLLNSMSSLNADVDKANLLIAIARKMPKTDSLKMTYMRTAHGIRNDPDYGRAVRAIE